MTSRLANEIATPVKVETNLVVWVALLEGFQIEVVSFCLPKGNS